MNQGKKGAITPLQLPDGRWMIRYSAPRAADGRRVQRRVYGADQAEAWSEYKRVSGQREKDVSDRKAKFGPWLSHQIDLRQSEGQHKESTVITDRRAADLYLIPGLGHLRLEELRRDDFRELGAAMRQLNRDEAAPSDMLGRLIRERSVVHGVRRSARPVGESTIRRTMASASAYLGPLVADGIIPLNPAGRVKGPKVRRPKPLLWTQARIAAWRKSGTVPGVVMVWDRPQAAQFLESIKDDRLLSMYRVAAYWGLRRAELAHLQWSDLDLASGKLHVRGDVKSQDSDRIISLDAGTVAMLREWRKAQVAERMQWGPAWTDTGLVWTRQDGTAPREAWISEHFDQAVAKAGLPPVHLHGLRHGAATMLLALGYPPKFVSETLGHSTVSFTMDTYTSVGSQMSESAAADLDAFISRRASTESDGGTR